MPVNGKKVGRTVRPTFFIARPSYFTPPLKPIVQPLFRHLDAWQAHCRYPAPAPVLPIPGTLRTAPGLTRQDHSKAIPPPIQKQAKHKGRMPAVRTRHACSDKRIALPVRSALPPVTVNSGLRPRPRCKTRQHGGLVVCPRLAGKPSGQCRFPIVWPCMMLIPVPVAGVVLPRAIGANS